VNGLTFRLSSRRVVFVSRLAWVERDHGWRAGPYEIELAAPQLWVCTREDRRGKLRVETTSGSLKALKTKVDRLEHRRQCSLRALRYLLWFALCMALVVLAVTLDVSIAPVLAAMFSIAGLMTALNAVDCVVRRSWEWVNLTYQ
jgi:hypothetical protein